MRARVALVIVGLGLAACSLLQLRQARLQAAHELAAAHSRARRLDDETLRLRAELAIAAAEAMRDPAPRVPAPVLLPQADAEQDGARHLAWLAPAAGSGE